MKSLEALNSHQLQRRNRTCFCGHLRKTFRIAFYWQAVNLVNLLFAASWHELYAWTPATALCSQCA